MAALVTAKRLTREELYELVWSKPMRDAAATIPLPSGGLKKWSLRQGIPVPPRGYWNKVRAGHRMPPRPALSPTPGPQRTKAELVKPPSLPGVALATQQRARKQSKETQPAPATTIRREASGATSK